MIWPCARYLRGQIGNACSPSRVSSPIRLGSVGVQRTDARIGIDDEF
jgi:hypothetical protein